MVTRLRGRERTETILNIELPVIPAGVLVLLSFFAPYAIALINHPSWKAGSKRLIAIVVSIVLGAIVLAGYYFMTGDLLPDWPVLILLAILVCQAAYTLLYKSAITVEGKHGVGSAPTA